MQPQITFETHGPAVTNAAVWFVNKNDVALSSYLRELGVTRERVRQLEAAALGKLRPASRNT